MVKETTTATPPDVSEEDAQAWGSKIGATVSIPAPVLPS
jgi:hypothetical protein